MPCDRDCNSLFKQMNGLLPSMASFFQRRLELEKERNDGLDPEQLELEMRERQTRLKQKKRDIAMVRKLLYGLL